MAYQLGDLKTKLQTQIGDPNLSDSVATDAINYAQQSIFNTFDSTLNSATATNSITAGTNVLASALPTDLQKIVNMRVTSPVALATSLKDYYVDPDTFRQQYPASGNYGSGLPSPWTYWTSVEFANTADQAYAVSIDYTKYVPQLSVSTDVPVVPQSFEELLMLGAKMRVYEQKEDFDYAAQFTNRYADLLEAFMNRYSTRQVDIQGNVPGSRFVSRTI